MVRAKTMGRIQKLRETIGEGCRSCKDRPLVHLLGEGGPLPPVSCSVCGRPVAGETHIFVGIDPALI